MFMRQILSKNHNAEADRINTPNVTVPPTHTLAGCDPDETKSLLMDTLSSTKTLEFATSKYSKCLSSKLEFKLSPILICVNFVIILPDLC